MTSEPRPAPDESSQQPGWTGGVDVGVAAWTGGDHPEQGGPVEDDPEADQEAVARKILLNQLTGQPRSRHELAKKLRDKDVPEELSARLLDRFEEVGLVDDEAFARMWIDSRQPGKSLGRRALAQELRRKGIGDEIAREALDAIEPEDEEAAARALVVKKLRSLQRVDATTATRRLVGMLARKGHAPGLAWRVVREELDARDDPALSEEFLDT